MLRKLIYVGIAGAIIASAAFWILTAPKYVDVQRLAALKAGDVVQGEQVFYAGGCASCHAAPGAKDEAKLVLAGGHELVSPFGTFVAPNISPSANGIGHWTLEQFANAMLQGVGVDGSHLYPSFPYGSYTKMTAQDMADLFAFMKTLPQSDNITASHRLAFPFNIRRSIGLWKQLYLSPKPVIELANASPQVQRGQYLVEALAHCGECHTPRNIIGGLEPSKWLAGAVSPEISSNGKRGTVPNITAGEGGIGSWSTNDIVYSLDSGFTPDFDALGGSMVDVVTNMHQLSSEDRESIAAYLKAIPAHSNGYPAR